MTGTTALVVGVHFLRYAGPLLYLPLVVRMLPIVEAGLFFRLQSLGLLLALAVEFGLSGTALRDWPRAETPEERNRLFNALMGERTGNALVLAALALAAAAAGLLSAVELLVALPLAILSGFNMTWYFMASGRPLRGSSIEAVSQAVGVALLLLALWLTGSAAAAVAALVVTQIVNLAIGLAAARRDGVAYRPGASFGLGHRVRQMPMFLVRIGALLSSAGSPWIVSTLGGAVQAGLYGPAARLFGALAATMSPVADVVIPIIARRTASVARTRALVITFGSLLVGAAIAVPIYLAVEPITTFLYGGLRSEALEVVRILVFSVPFVFAGQALSLFVLVPGGRESLAAIAILIGAAVFVVLAFLNGTAEGAAVAKVWADGATVAAMLALTLLRPASRDTRDA